jgi:hypothetical protein
MVRGLGAIALILLAVASAAAHQPIVLDSRHATPGLLLELTAVGDASDEPRYRLKASGFPTGVVFGVWTRDFGHGFHEVATGFAMDPSGRLRGIAPDASGERPWLDDLVLRPGRYPLGAIWEVALVSVDRTQTAFTKVIPQPLRAQDGPCSLSLELVSHRGDRFLATGAGFAAGDEVVIESRVAGQVTRKRQRVSVEGRLRPDVISHGAVGEDRRARYAVTARACAVALDYEWGESALVPR